MAVTTYSSNGTPSDAVGVTGDFVIDYGGRFLWGPKPSDTSWSGSAKSIVGPTGPPNALPQMINVAAAYGPGVQFTGQTMGTTNGAANTLFTFNGSPIPNTFTPQANSALVGIQATNYGASNATIYPYLQDLTTNQLVYSYNAGNGLASGSVISASFSNTAYPLIAGRTYQWQGIRATAGATTAQINPLYLTQSGTPSSLSYYTPFVLTSAGATIARQSSALTFNPGMVQQAYYRNSNPSYMYYIEFWISGSGGQAGPFLYNSTTSANQFVMDNYGGYPTLTSTLTRYLVGPFAPSMWGFNASQTYFLSVYSPTGATVTSFYAQIVVGQ